MRDEKTEKISLAVQDSRTPGAGARPACADAGDCTRCPAITSRPNRWGTACLFEIIRRKGKTVKESMRTIFCCDCRRPMVLIPGPGGRKLWNCTTPGCVIHEYARRKNRYPVHENK